jgi:DNA-binding response OmpR family regulator
VRIAAGHDNSGFGVDRARTPGALPDGATPAVRRHIVVLDPEAGFVRDFGRILRRADFTVHDPKSERDAWSTLERVQPVLVVLVAHPALPSDLPFLRRLRAAGRRVPVLLVSDPGPELGLAGAPLETAGDSVEVRLIRPFSAYELLLRIDIALRPRSQDPFGLRRVGSREE